ncbi:hypothetical protein ASG87_06145 [Frateuria sp. Soil773]|nr:hypothetical protein ASG87_06145 [Frateuria sp. Soil773]
MAIAGVATAAPVQHTNSVQLSNDTAGALGASTLNLTAMSKHVDVDTGDGHWHYDPAFTSATALADAGNASYSFDV